MYTHKQVCINAGKIWIKSLVTNIVPIYFDEEMGKRFECFTEEDIWMENKLMERCPKLLVIREIQIKITVVYNN